DHDKLVSRERIERMARRRRAIEPRERESECDCQDRLPPPHTRCAPMAEKFTLWRHCGPASRIETGILAKTARLTTDLRLRPGWRSGGRSPISAPSNFRTCRARVAWAEPPEEHTHGRTETKNIAIEAGHAAFR